MGPGVAAFLVALLISAGELVPASAFAQTVVLGRARVCFVTDARASGPVVSVAALARDAGLRVIDARGSVFFPPSDLAVNATAPAAASSATARHGELSAIEALDGLNDIAGIRGSLAERFVCRGRYRHGPAA